MSVWKRKWVVEMESRGGNICEDFVVRARSKQDAISAAHYENFKKRRETESWVGWKVTRIHPPGRVAA